RKDARRKMHASCAAVGVSALAHMIAVGALLMQKPAPYAARPLHVIEISLVPEQSLSGPHANNSSGAIPWNPSPDWSRGVTMSHSFDGPPLSTFSPHMQAPAFDTLATTPDCLASRRWRRPYPPCASDDPLLRAPVMTLLPMDPSLPSETEIDYRTFKPIQSVF